MSDREAAIRLAAFIEREKAGKYGSFWQYDPRPDIESVLAELAAAREREAKLREALREAEFQLAPTNKGEFWYEALLLIRRALADGEGEA